MPPQSILRGQLLAATVALGLCTGLSATALADQEPCIGNSAAVTGPAAFSGLAIKMGAEIAIDEINAAGGVLGKKLRLVQYDDAGAPPRGVDNTRRIALADKCIAVLGGFHSTVALAQVDPIHEIGIPYMGVWAANTKAIENGRDPNFMFRVSAKDKWVARFLVDEALKASKTGKGKELVAAETFNWNDQDMSPQVIRARDAGADVVIVWSLDREANQILRSMDKASWKPAIIGAWGISGNLGELAGPLANGVRVMQTYSFLTPQSEAGKKLLAAVEAKTGIKDPKDIKAPSGIANSYDAVYVLADAIKIAGSFDWKKVQQALYQVSRDGLVAPYKPAFDKADPERQDAILPQYYLLTVWHDGKLIPLKGSPYDK